MIFGISLPVWFPRIDFTACKLTQEKAAKQKWRKNPCEFQIVKFADDDDQRDWCMNGHKPPERQFPETAADVSERKINDKCGHTGVKKAPFKSEHIIEKVHRQISVCW